VDIYLESDCGGFPCAVIEQMVLTNALQLGSSSIVTVNSTANSALNSQTPYWLVLTAGAADTVAFWYVNLDNDFSNSTDFVAAFSGNTEGPWSQFGAGQSRPAFEIDGNLLPAPQPPGHRRSSRPRCSFSVLACLASLPC
jgi:hypothetical protein